MDYGLQSLVDHEGCRGCPQHRVHGAGCAVVDPAAAVALDSFLGREPCFLKEWLRHFAARFLAHRPRSMLEPDDLAQEVFSRLLADVRARAGGFAPGLGAFLAYLRSAAARCAIEAERREHGRMRCGNCRNYAAWSGVCLRVGHAWTHREVGAAQDPRALDPACRGFDVRRSTAELSSALEATLQASVPAASDADPVTARVLAALVEIAALHPRAALVLRARLLEGRTYDDLSALGVSVRTLKRDYAHGLELLRERLA